MLIPKVCHIKLRLLKYYYNSIKLRNTTGSTIVSETLKKTKNHFTMQLRSVTLSTTQLDTNRCQNLTKCLIRRAKKSHLAKHCTNW